MIDLRKGSWTNEKHAAQWRSSLSRHVLPDLGAMPVDQISTAEVLGVLTPIWSEKAETATRVKQRMAIIFDYCIAAGWRHDNPCNGALKAALPRRPRQRRHHPAMPYSEVGAAMQAVEDANGHESSKLALLFTVLTAARTGEVRAATWDEIDMKGRVWTVPAEHMKMRREHRVPLSSGGGRRPEDSASAHQGPGLSLPIEQEGVAAVQQHGADDAHEAGWPRPLHGTRVPGVLQDVGA